MDLEVMTFEGVDRIEEAVDRGDLWSVVNTATPFGFIKSDIFSIS
jgi:hypothetical protein